MTHGAARALLRPSARDRDAAPVSETRLTAVTRGLPAAAREPASAPSAAPRFKGPMELDLNRIVLLHRVEDIPPPPDFVFEPFVSSRLVEPDPPASNTTLVPIEPVACRVVDARDARRRVARGWRVDIAPCLSIGASLPASTPAASAAEATPAASLPQEPGRRLPRRRGRAASRALSPLPDSEEVSRAIHELEAAFGPAALCSAPNEGAGVVGCRANGA